MKRQSIYLLLLTGLLFLFSCYEDLSTDATGSYPEIVLDAGDTPESLTCGYGETLHLTVNASQEGTDPADLSYEWMIDIVPEAGKDRAVISEGPEVEYLVLNSPNSKPYNLTLYVKNTKDGYTAIKNWHVYVVSTLGDGLLVAHTRDGGKTTQLSLTCASPITYAYSASAPRVTDRLYELANGGKSIEGRVTGLLARATSDLEAANPNSYGTERVMVTTDRNEILMLDPLNYSLVGRNEDLFSGTRYFSKFESRLIGNVSAVSTFVSVEGHLYGCMEVMEYKYSPVSYGGTKTGVFGPNNTCAPLTNQGFIMCFDPVTKKFYGCNGVFLTQSSMTAYEGVDTVPEADWLADKEAVACGALKSLNTSYVMKDSADQYYLVEICINQGTKAKIVPLNLPEVDKAIGWAFCDNCEVVYYYTPDTIYSTIVSGSTSATKALSWKPDSSDEKITMVRQYTQGWYGTGQKDNSSKPGDLTYYEYILDTNRTQIVIVTYNEKTGEGKFYLRPFNVSTGMFSAFKNNGTYGGYGEITAICGTRR